MEIGISIHFYFYQSREQTKKLNVGELYSKSIIIPSNILLMVIEHLFQNISKIYQSKSTFHIYLIGISKYDLTLGI